VQQKACLFHSLMETVVLEGPVWILCFLAAFSKMCPNKSQSMLMVGNVHALWPYERLSVSGRTS
jgi:hypothetical protein